MKTIKEIENDVRGYDSIIKATEVWRDNPFKSIMHEETEYLVIPKKVLDRLINESTNISLEIFRILELNK